MSNFRGTEKKRAVIRRVALLVWTLALSTVLGVGGDLNAASVKKKSRSSKASSSVKKSSRVAKPQSLSNRLVSLKRQYRRGEIGKRAMWEELGRIYSQGSKLMIDDRVSLLLLQASMLQEAGYPILSAIYASQAVKISPNARSKEIVPGWEILKEVAEKKPIQNLLEVVADNVKLPNNGNGAPVFDTDWYYFAGNAAAREDDNTSALKYYGSLKVNDRYFFSAKYQQAMIYVDQNKLSEANVALKAILYPATQNMSPLSEKARAEMADSAYLALGRINYEQEHFLDSAKAYRMVRKAGPNFYDALFEQSWAFFMGGYPMHALGALYGVESPFYADVFNPEATILRALVHYWLCRYEDSRNALADFMDKHADGVESLGEFLDRKRLDSETAYQLFEDLLSGVSSDSLGVPRVILQTAAEKDSMLLVRDQYASIIEEKSRLEARGIFGSKRSLAKPLDYMERWSSALRKDVGKKFLAELQYMKKDYERLYAQAEFLYVELLMSEREQILGKELHASSKITRVSSKMNLNGWGQKTQSWKDSKKGEYWWDEVGFYINRVESQCNVQR
jgi:hypothetical protein